MLLIVDLAVKAARQALISGDWPKMLPSHRGELLYKRADLIEGNKEELARLETLDNGKPVSEALSADLPFAITMYRYYAGWADKIQGETIPIGAPYFTSVTRGVSQWGCAVRLFLGTSPWICKRISWHQL